MGALPACRRQVVSAVQSSRASCVRAFEREKERERERQRERASERESARSIFCRPPDRSGAIAHAHTCAGAEKIEANIPSASLWAPAHEAMQARMSSPPQLENIIQPSRQMRSEVMGWEDWTEVRLCGPARPYAQEDPRRALSGMMHTCRCPLLWSPKIEQIAYLCGSLRMCCQAFAKRVPDLASRHRRRLR